MTRWWTKVKGRPVEEHKTKLSAGIRLSFAVNEGGVSIEDVGLYRRNPEKYPNEPNCIRAEMVKAAKRAKKLHRK